MEPDGWASTTLGEVADLRVGFAFKSRDFTARPSDPRLLRGENVGQGELNWSNVRRWDATSTTGLDRYWLDVGDVVLAMDRPWIAAGLKYAVVRPLDLPALLVQRVARLRGGPKLDVGYLRYVIASRSFTEYVLSVQTGTTIPHISGAQILGFTWPIPPMHEQQAIGAVLGALDDKIELNRRMSETLDHVAGAIFRNWFFEGGGLDVPANGWPVGRLEDVLELRYGKSLPKARHVPGIVPVYGSGGIYGWHDRPLVDDPTVIVGRKGTVGSIYWEHRPSHPADTVFYVVSEAPLSFCYYLLQNLGLRSMNTDAAVPGLNRSNAYRLEVPLPPPDVMMDFDQHAAPLRSRIELADSESHTLASLRDALLPKLISGEIRVPDAERAVSEVA